VDAPVTLAEQERRLLAELGALRDPQARFAWLVERARQRPALPAEFRTDAHRVPGCLARLWLVPEFQGGRCQFRSESDSLVVKAIAGLLCDFYSGRAPEEIVAHPPGFLGALGLAQLLTSTRRTSLHRVWDLMCDFARAHQAGGS
jgi:cysteine desulfuration protein SufE